MTSTLFSLVVSFVTKHQRLQVQVIINRHNDTNCDTSKNMKQMCVVCIEHAISTLSFEMAG
jgi:hypothetical protein